MTSPTCDDIIHHIGDKQKQIMSFTHALGLKILVLIYFFILSVSRSFLVVIALPTPSHTKTDASASRRDVISKTLAAGAAIAAPAISNAYFVPELPYAYDALEPYIDAPTMKLHRDKHHQSEYDIFFETLSCCSFVFSPLSTHFTL